MIYRVAQEALTNVARHAGASRVALALEAADGEVVLSVADDGSGLPPGATRGQGIRGMRERAMLAGGRIDLGGTPGRGTRVRLAIPLR